MEVSKTYDTRTISLQTPKGDFLRVLSALTHQSKNLFNSGYYLIKQVLTSFEYDSVAKVSRIKSELHERQLEAIAHFNVHIQKVNNKRTKEFPKKLAKAKPDAKGKEPVLKLIPVIEDTMKSLVGSILDPTILDNAVRHWRDDKGQSAYRKLPGVMAQQVLKHIREGYSSYFEAIKRYRTNPSGMTGKPQMPGYLFKHDRFVVDVPFVQIYKALPCLKGREISEDDFAEKVEILSPEVIAVYDGYDMIEAIKVACEKRGWRDYEPQHLRIIPLKRGVRLELVVRIPNPYPAGSYLAGIVDQHHAELKKLKSDIEREKWLLDRLAKLDDKNLPNIAGIDLGKTNMATVAYSTGHKAVVHTGGRFIAVTEEMLAKIGKRVSEITPDRAKELQAKKLELQKDKKHLEKTEEIGLRTLLKSLYADERYKRLVRYKENWIKDYLHKLSSQLVKDCENAGIDVIVVGRNVGWKQKVNLGTKTNRQFCMIGHANLIKLLRYKAEAKGIAVVTTEESYTSKTSFVNNDELECFAEKQTRKVSSSTLPVKTGKRSSADRNWFRHADNTCDERLKWVHADVNGAFNIIHKVFAKFRYRLELSLKFTLMRLSPRLGVVPILLPV